MAGFNALWRAGRRWLVGRLLVAMLIGSVLVGGALMEETGGADTSLCRVLGMGPPLGLLAVLPLEYLAWRKKRKPGEHQERTAIDDCTLMGFILGAIVVFAFLVS